MRTSLFNRFAGLLIAFSLTSGTVFASDYLQGKVRNNQASKPTCVNSISGLTQEQKDKITAMEADHWKEMDALRQSRRSTTDTAQKAEVRKQMDASVANHRNAVKGLLNAEQQKQYDALHASGGNHRYQRPSGQQGSGSGQGLHRGGGRGRGR